MRYCRYLADDSVARYALVEERAYLTELLTLICTPPGQAPYDAVLAERAVRGLLGLPI